MNDVVDLNEYKKEKFNDNRIESMRDAIKDLRAAYIILKPHFKYKVIFNLAKTIVDIRRSFLTKIKELKEK